MNQSLAAEVVIHLQIGLSWMIIMSYFEPSEKVAAVDASIPLRSPAPTVAVTPRTTRWR
jgi:hypothetical protein